MLPTTVVSECFCEQLMNVEKIQDNKCKRYFSKELLSPVLNLSFKKPGLWQILGAKNSNSIILGVIYKNCWKWFLHEFRLHFSSICSLHCTLIWEVIQNIWASLRPTSLITYFRHSLEIVYNRRSGNFPIFQNNCFEITTILVTVSGAATRCWRPNASHFSACDYRTCCIWHFLLEHENGEDGSSQIMHQLWFALDG